MENRLYAYVYNEHLNCISIKTLDIDKIIFPTQVSSLYIFQNQSPCSTKWKFRTGILFFFCFFFCLFLGLTSLWNIWGHITTVPACSSGTLTNVLPHRNAMPQTQDTTPHPVTVYRHGADLSLCYPLMWNVTLEYTATHFNVLGETRPGNPSPTFHTHQRCHCGQQSEAQ